MAHRGNGAAEKVRGVEDDAVTTKTHNEIDELVESRALLVAVRVHKAPKRWLVGHKVTPHMRLHMHGCDIKMLEYAILRM